MFLICSLCVAIYTTILPYPAIPYPYYSIALLGYRYHILPYYMHAMHNAILLPYALGCATRRCSIKMIYTYHLPS